MRLARWLAAAGLVGAVVSAHAAPPERKLLRNGDFESGIGEWRIVDRSGSLTVENDTKVKQGGKQSLRIARSGPGGPDWIKQSAPVPVGAREVHATCWFKVDKGARADVSVYYFDGKGETIGKGDMSLVSEAANKKWAKADERFAVPKGATGVGVNVKVTTEGTFWLDDLELSVAAGASNAPLALANGGFESGLDGWQPLPFGSGVTDAKADPSARVGGKASLRIDRASPRLAPEEGLWADVFCDSDPGKVRLTFQARLSDAVRATVVLQTFDAADICTATERAAVSAGTGKFAAGTLLLAAPAGTKRLTVSLCVAGAGTAWFDDLVLAPEK